MQIKHHLLFVFKTHLTNNSYYWTDSGMRKVSKLSRDTLILYLNFAYEAL